MKAPTQLTITPKAIIGLGNPGQKYHYHRHNIGFRVLDAIAEAFHASWSEGKEMLHTTITVNDIPILLVKPQTFMNDSGRIIPQLTKRGIKPEEIIVVHDELEKPFGTMSLKIGGSHRGHNGLRSLIATFGDNFARLRCGIGRPERRENVPHYVLTNFSEPSSEVEAFIEQVVNHLEGLLAP